MRGSTPDDGFAGVPIHSSRRTIPCRSSAPWPQTPTTCSPPSPPSPSRATMSPTADAPLRLRPRQRRRREPVAASALVRCAGADARVPGHLLRPRRPDRQRLLALARPGHPRIGHRARPGAGRGGRVGPSGRSPTGPQRLRLDRLRRGGAPPGRPHPPLRVRRPRTRHGGARARREREPCGGGIQRDLPRARPGDDAPRLRALRRSQRTNTPIAERAPVGDAWPAVFQPDGGPASTRAAARRP